MSALAETRWPAVAATTDIAEDREEAVWISRACSGDESAFGWLLSRYRGRAVRLAAHVLRRPDEAEDAAQEAFIRAFRSIRSFRGQGRFYTWLYHIVVRVCLDRKRLARWSAEVSHEESMLFRTSHDPREASDARLAVESLMDRLSAPMRAALVLRELEGMEYEEIAQVLEIPIGTVRSRLNTARAQFRELWHSADSEAKNV